MKKKGFTLIELIAVIAILAILAAIAVPRIISYVDRSKKIAVQAEARIIYEAAEEAYNAGILVPNENNIILGMNGDEPIKDSKPRFDDIMLNNVVKGKISAIEILNKNNLLSNSGKNNIGILQRVPVLGWLPKIMEAKVEDIEVDKNGVFLGIKEQ